jgi:hypothetical protein
VSDAFEIPPRSATDAATRSKHLLVTFDVDLGELCEGHHVVARGIEVWEKWSYLHYEFVPAASDDDRPFFFTWEMDASDDIATDYGDFNGGAFAAGSTGPASHGVRDIGCAIPTTASVLTLRFEPANDWTPPSRVVAELAIDLRTGATTALP